MKTLIAFCVAWLLGPVVMFGQLEEKHEQTNKPVRTREASFLKVPAIPAQALGQPEGVLQGRTATDLSQISYFAFQNHYAPWESFGESAPVTLSNGDVLVMWATLYSDSLYSVRSTDGGTTWGSPAFAALTNGRCRGLSAVRTQGTRIVALWKSPGAGFTMCFSEDEGASWSSATTVTADPGDRNPTLTQTADGALWLIYSRFGSSVSNDLYCRISADSGTSWGNEQTFLASSAEELYGSIISVDSSTLLAVHQDNSSGNDDLYSRFSTDGGGTWSAATPVVSTPARESRPRVVRHSDGRLWLLYQVLGNSTGGFMQSDIYFTASSDSGGSWDTPTAFTTYKGADVGINVCVSGDRPFVTFASNRWAVHRDHRQLWYGVPGTSLDEHPPPVLAEFIWSAPVADESVPVQAFVDDEEGIATVSLGHSVNGQYAGSIPLFDDGTHEDGLAGDNIWGGTIGPFPLGDVVDFSVDIEDVSSNTVWVYIEQFEACALHDTGEVVLKFGSNSALGEHGRPASRSAYWPKIGGYDYLYDGGLWVGCDVGGEKRVMDYFYQNSNWRRSEGTPYTLGPGLSDQDGAVSYDDRFSDPVPLGVRVHQQSYQWSDQDRDDFIIFTYTMENTGATSPLTDLFVSLWLDVDIALETQADDDMGGYDSQRKLVYMYSADNNPSGYFGVRLLGDGNPPHTVNVFHIGQDAATDEDRYQLMTQTGVALPSSPGDCRILLTAAPFSLAAGDSFTVAFGLVLGDGVDELGIHADTMEALYIRKLVTNAERPSAESVPVPNEFALSQNYPNPFNPSTTIEYELPQRVHVSLRVFNLLGQEVAVLVDDVQGAGYQSVEFNAADLPSGVFLYRLAAGDFVETRKLVVLR